MRWSESFAGKPHHDHVDSATLGLQEIVMNNPSHVFLAACYGGAPNRTLPDEALRFPSAFLVAGARTVIAPLWPVDDQASLEFVREYYTNVIRRGQSTSIALKNAAHTVRDNPALAPGTTWAAFAVFGV